MQHTNMKRDLINSLIQWKSAPYRKPLILRGARQVGKSWLVEEFSREFDSFVELNFERDRKIHSLFQGDLNIPHILERLSLYSQKKIETGKTLLFFDEIQECEDALKSLRYFKEKCPELHVIAAGSLIDFSIKTIGLPVGRVQFLYLYPLSFGEFLSASGHQEIRDHLRSHPPESLLHGRLLDILRTYLWLGGMPAVVKAWFDHKDPQICQRLQNEILIAYKQDFQKYARKKQIEHVTGVFESIPTQLGRKFKYSNVDREIRVYPLKQALQLLVQAGVATLCFHSSGQGQPLGAGKNEKKFKVFFFDVGLAQKILGLNLREWIVAPLEASHLGGIAEQFVAQEFAAYHTPDSPAELYYWHRESPKSNAEVDFLFLKEGQVVPVEVKSGVKGGLKSIRVFLETHKNTSFGLKISSGIHEGTDRLREIPLYGVEGWLA